MHSLSSCTLCSISSNATCARNFSGPLKATPGNCFATGSNCIKKIPGNQPALSDLYHNNIVQIVLYSYENIKLVGRVFKKARLAATNQS